jgi:hypothetical protein
VCLVPEYDGGVALNWVEGRAWGGATGGRQALSILGPGRGTGLGSGGVAFNSTSCTNRARLGEVGSRRPAYVF